MLWLVHEIRPSEEEKDPAMLRRVQFWKANLLSLPRFGPCGGFSAVLETEMPAFALRACWVFAEHFRIRIWKLPAVLRVPPTEIWTETSA